jgi:hypothetical protein
VTIPHWVLAAPAQWRTAVLLAGAAALPFAAGCSGATSAGSGTSPGAGPGTAASAARRSPAPLQWRLVRASGHLHDITVAVPACQRIARIAVRESRTRAVITVYAHTGQACSWRDVHQRTVYLARPISCQRTAIDGATGRAPEFARHADTASVTFACPASIS